MLWDGCDNTISKCTGCRIAINMSIGIHHPIKIEEDIVQSKRCLACGNDKAEIEYTTDMWRPRADKTRKCISCQNAARNDTKKCPACNADKKQDRLQQIFVVTKFERHKKVYQLSRRRSTYHDKFANDEINYCCTQRTNEVGPNINVYKEMCATGTSSRIRKCYNEYCFLFTWDRPSGRANDD